MLFGRTWTSSLVGLLGCALFSITPIARASEQTVEQLLKDAEQATAWISHAAVSMKTQYARVPHDPSVPARSTRDLWWFENGERVCVRSKSHGFDDSGKQLADWEIEAVRLYEPGRFLYYLAIPERPPLVLVAEEAADAQARCRNLRFDEFSGSALNGNMGAGAGGPQNILLLARTGAPRLAGEQVIDGTACTIVSSVTPLGALRIWIAPQRGHNVLRWELSQGSLASEWFKDSFGKPFQSFTAVFDQAKVREVGGRYVLVAGRVVNVLRQSDGSEITDTYIAERETVDLAPDFASYHAFETSDIPDGIEARYFSRKGPMKYVWRSGKALPYYDPSLLSSMEQSVQSTTQPGGSAPAPGHQTAAAAKEPTPSSTRSATILAVSAAAVVLLIGIGLHLWRRQGSQRGR